MCFVLSEKTVKTIQNIQKKFWSQNGLFFLAVIFKKNFLLKKCVRNVINAFRPKANARLVYDNCVRSERTQLW